MYKTMEFGLCVDRFYKFLWDFQQQRCSLFLYLSEDEFNE